MTIQQRCYVKMHKRGKDTVIAACDEHLLGKTLRKGLIKFVIKPSFYGGKLIPLNELVEYVEKGTIINLVGNAVVKEASKRWPILIDGAVEIDGVLHVQWIRR
ncbi:MAG TPA: DUF424 family protein [Thermofilum sp.]|nr:DUF424 family protein [Thermofilum sp.]